MDILPPSVRPLKPKTLIPDRMLKASDVAFYCNASVRTVWRWAQRGILAPPVRMGKNTSRWRPEDVRRMLEPREGVDHAE